MHRYIVSILASIIDQSRAIVALLLLALAAGCAVQPPAAPANAQACPAAAPCPVCPTCPTITPPPPKAKTLEAVGWTDVTGWTNDDPAGAWDAFLRGCARLSARTAWRESCALAQRLPADASIREFFEEHFLPYRVANPDGSVRGLVTGYYEPLLRGSRIKEGPYRYPLYAAPEDLLIVDLAEVNS